MTPEERDQFYDEFYKASKWNNRWIYLYPSHFFDHVEN